MVQFLNILVDTVTAAVLQPLPTKMVLIFLQSMNMPGMLVTFAVLKLLRSRFVKLVHPLNMLCILVTFEVLKLLTSSLLKPEQ